MRLDQQPLITNDNCQGGRTRLKERIRRSVVVGCRRSLRWAAHLEKRKAAAPAPPGIGRLFQTSIALKFSLFYELDELPSWSKFSNHFYARVRARRGIKNTGICPDGRDFSLGAVCQPARTPLCSIRIRPSKGHTEHLDAPVLPPLEGCDYFAQAR